MASYQQAEVPIGIPPAPMPPAGPPPPGPAASVGGFKLPCAPHTLVAGANLCIGAGLFIVNFISVFTSLATFRLSAFVVLLFIALGGLSLALVALVSLTFVASMFGFLQYPAGTGSFMILLGTMSFGNGTFSTVLAILGWVCGFASSSPSFRSSHSWVNPVLGSSPSLCPFLKQLCCRAGALARAPLPTPAAAHGTPMPTAKA